MYEKGVWEYDAGHLAEGAAIQGSDVEESPDAGRVSLTSAG